MNFLQSKIMITKFWESISNDQKESCSGVIDSLWLRQFIQWVTTATRLIQILQILTQRRSYLLYLCSRNTGGTVAKKHFVLIYETLRGWGGHTSVMQRENWVHRPQADKFPWTCNHNISWEVSWVTLVAWWNRTRRMPSIQGSVFFQGSCSEIIWCYCSVFCSLVECS